MKQPLLWPLFAGLCLVLLFACSTPERSSGREVRKDTKDQRKAAVVLVAKQGNDYLNLRENNFFDYYGLDTTNRAALYAGSYAFKGDSLMLAFYNNNKPADLIGKAWVDRIHHQLILLARDPSRNRKMAIVMGGN